MKSTIYTLSFIFALQIIIFLGSKFFAPKTKEIDLFNFQNQEISEIKIKDKNNQLILKKQNDDFLVDKLKANSSLALSFLNALNSLEPPFVSSKTKEAKERFLVDDSNYNHQITLITNNREITFYVGQKESPNNYYLRLDNDENIYLVNLRDSYLTTKKSSWIDLNLLSKKNIQQLITKNLQLAKTSNSWQILGQINNDNTAIKDIDSFILLIENLQISSLATDQQIAKVNKNEFKKIQIKQENNDYEYLFYELDENNYLLKSNEFIDYFVIEKSKITPILDKKAEDFLQQESTKINETQNESLSENIILDTIEN